MPKLEYPGFIGLSDQVLFRGASEPPDKTKQQPRVILIYGWGDAQARHVAKYADGFQKLFPSANQVVVLSPISRAMWQSLETRAANMSHVVKAAFGSEDASRDEGSVLVHMMSNTGAIFYAATLHAYRETYGKPLPHRLVVLDSTPGSTDISLETLPRFSRAMALGTAAWFPWPFIVTQCLWAMFLVGNHLLERIMGRDSNPVISLKAFQNPDMQDKGAKRLYLYSKEDQIILWTDLEKHVAESREQGWQTDCVLFEGSGHVGHMRLHPEKYWGDIYAAWNEAVSSKNNA